MSKPSDHKGERDRRRKERPAASELQGYRLFKKMQGLLKVLRDADAHPNRKLHFDEYAILLLFYFFNPLIDSLRGLQEVTDLKRVQKALGIRRMSLGSLSESVQVFDPTPLGNVFRDMAALAPNRSLDERLKGLDQVLTVVDGSVLRALPRMVWALWVGESDRGVKIHTQFEVAKDTPVEIGVDVGKSSETDYLLENVEPGRLYVLDRGYAHYELLQRIFSVGSSVVVRIRKNAAIEVLRENEKTPDWEEAGVVSDQVIRLGAQKRRVDKELRLVTVHVPQRASRSLAYPVKKVSSDKSRRREPGQAYTLQLVTDRMDIPADVIALIYQHRWKVELFFRTFKGLLGCRHLLSESLEGVTIQVYAALIASLLFAEFTGVRPTKRVYELLGMYLSGWVEEDELVQKLEKHRRT